MTRTLTITAAEWASAQDGTLWLVRDGDWPKACPLADPESCNGEHCDCRLGPPAEFVLACAPCGTCHSTRRSSEWDVYDMRHNAPCPDCCIELVGSCPNAEGCPAGMAPLSCGRCYQIVQVGGTVTLGHAYAVGQPLPIAHTTQAVKDSTAVHLSNGKLYLCVMDGYRVLPENCHDITASLAHYGQAESLVGKWALQLAVTA